MNRFKSYRSGLLLLLLLLLPAAALAQDGMLTPPPVQTLRGTLSIVWADPLPLGSAPEVPLYFLHATGAETRQLFLDPSSSMTPSKMLEWDRDEVIVELDDGDILRSIAPDEAALTSRTADIATPTATGEQRWVSIGCKFADRAAEPRDAAYLQEMYRSTRPGLNHYWPEVSRGSITLRGEAFAWFDLPHPWSHYAGIEAKDTKTGPFIDDCTAAADAAIYYPAYDGVQLFFNDELAQSGFAIAPSGYLTLDGQTKYYQITMSTISGNEKIGTIMHEMGHTYGMDHSLIDRATENEYRNAWDVMGKSDYNCDAARDAEFGCVGGFPSAYNLREAGWIPEKRVFTSYWPGPSTITLERIELPQTENYLLAVIPYPGDPESYLTVEARQRVSYDEKLPGDAVIIHKVSDNRPTIVDSDGNHVSDDEGAMWRVGESYTDADAGARIKINSKTATGYVITISYPELGEPNDSVAKAADLGTAYAWSNPLVYYGAIPDADDIDYIEFSYLSEGLFDDSLPLRIDLIAQSAGSALDSELALYYWENGKFELAARNDDYGEELDSKIFLRDAPKGAYLLQVQAVNPGELAGQPAYYALEILGEGDPYEPNDVSWDAAPLVYNEVVRSAAIGLPGDQDYFRFQGAKDDKVLLDIDAQVDSSAMDAVLALFDSENRLLAEMDDYAEEPDPYLTFTLPADGDYIARVREFNHGTAGGELYRYTLRLCVENNSEPNNSAAQAVPITYGQVRSCETIESAADRDYFSFSGKSGELVRAQALANDLGSPLDAQLTLYGLDAGGSLVELAANDDQGNASLDPYILHELSADGTYYLEVRSSPSQNLGGPNYSYNLALYVESDRHEPNDSAPWATDIGYGTIVRDATIGVPGDVDTYVFYGRAGDEITVRTDAAETTNSKLYALLSLHDSNMEQLDDGWYGYSDYGPNLDFELPEDGTYYLRVSNDPEDGAGSDYYYDLWLNKKDRNEPNDNAGNATPIDFRRSYYGIVESKADKDYFVFTGAAGDLIRAEIEASDLGSPLDPQLVLYQEASGSLVELAAEDGLGFASLDPMLVHQLPAGGTYYLLVRSENKPEDGWRDNFYFLSLFQESDPNEPNDYYVQATPVDYGETIDDATIGVPGDQDYYSFIGLDGQMITADIDALSDQSGLYAQLCLLDSNLNELWCWPEWIDADPLLDFTLPADDTYFLLVRGKTQQECSGPICYYQLTLQKKWTFFLPLTMNESPSGE